MKLMLPLNDSWQMSKSDDAYEYTRDFEINEDFCDGRIYLEFDSMSPDVSVLLNGVETASAADVPLRKLKVQDWVHSGDNEIEIRSEHELPPEAFNRARLVSYDKVSISDVDIEPEITGNTANVWITITLANHTAEDQDILASAVVAQGESREKIEVVESISPFGGEVEAVIRIVDSEMWQPNEAGDPAFFECLIGLQIEGEVMDVALVRFTVP